MMHPDSWLLERGWQIFQNGKGSAYAITYQKDAHTVHYTYEAVAVEKAVYGNTFSFDAEPAKAPEVPFVDNGPDPCLACGSTDYHSYTKRDVKVEGKEEKVLRTTQCDRCQTVIKPDYPRDASGNRVVVTETGKYSYATDGPITSARQLAEHCKKNNLVQRG